MDLIHIYRDVIWEYYLAIFLGSVCLKVVVIMGYIYIYIYKMHIIWGLSYLILIAQVIVLKHGSYMQLPCFDAPSTYHRRIILQSHWMEVIFGHGNDLVGNQSMEKRKHVWLVVLTILKNISQWKGLSHILWKTNNMFETTNQILTMSTLDWNLWAVSLRDKSTYKYPLSSGLSLFGGTPGINQAGFTVYGNVALPWLITNG